VDREDPGGQRVSKLQARSAVRCRSGRVSDAVNPAKIATFPIGSIVVQIVAKSLLILINRGDMVDLRRQWCEWS
jgi:hypothetical protein